MEDMVDLLLLGTGAMVPLPQRWLSSLLVRVDGSLILFDCGEGTQIAWRNFHWGFKRLDAICISHHHADHVAGLPGLFHTVANAGRTEPMHIYGPPGTIAMITGLRVIAPDLPYLVIVHDVEGDDTFELPGQLMVRVQYGDHRIPVLGYRVERRRARAFDAAKAESLAIPVEQWGPMQRGEPVTIDGVQIGADAVLGKQRPGVSFAFITDTRPTESLRQFAEAVDLLICEGTYGDDEDAEKAAAYGHMTFGQAATLARDAGVGTLWLTHFGAGMAHPEAFANRATRIFQRTILGESGLTGQLGFKGGYRTLSTSGDTSHPGTADALASSE